MSGSHAGPIPVQYGAPAEETVAPVDVQEDIAQLRRMVIEARAMPMSSSCVINRGEALELIDQLTVHLTKAFEHATRLDAERSEIVRRARDEAEVIVSDAQSRHDDLVSDSEVFRLASRQAEQLLSAANEESRMLRRDADDYVEGRLAALETSLQATLEAVTRGRSRLRGRNPLEELGGDPAKS